MVKRMLIDATHPEETRVVVVNGNRLEEFDFETSTKKQLKGNIYLAKVTRVEPSLQAAFVEFGGNRHGFLAFNEIHPDYYRIPIADREALLAAQRAEVDDEPDLPPPLRARRPAVTPDIPRTPAPDVIEAAAPSGDGVDDGAPDVVPAPDGDQAALSSPPATLYGELEAAEPIARRDGEPPSEGPPASSPSSDAVLGEPPQLADAGSAPPIDFVETVGGEQPSIGEPWNGPEISGEAAPTPAGESSQPTSLVPVVEPQNGGAPPVESVGGEEIDEIEHRRRLRPTRHYKIQEVIKRRQVLLVQVVKEERGTKGAALTTYLSLAGRYCVLMPNTDRGGGISRRITSAQDRKRLKSIMDELQVPDGMAVILRTAGMERSKPEIRRDYEYLMRLWDDIRELTLKSTAPTLIYEEGNLIKRAIRDLYSRDIDEILVEGEEGYKAAKSFMKMLMPSHVGRVQLYNDPAVPLFQRFQVESEIDAIHQPTVRLKSGGYIVIGQTEALVAIDVNSGRSTRERHIEETALKTNIEAADEIARQLRLRDLAGLIVIDFIDMEDTRHQHQVERRLKEAMKNDRARIQIGRISPFGLLELSRQRLRPSLAEVSSERCPHCGGTGYVRSTESTALHVLRGIEEEGMRLRTAEVLVHVPTTVAMYILNQKRGALASIESRYGLKVTLERDDALIPPAYRLDRARARAADAAPPQPQSPAPAPTPSHVRDIEAEAPEPAIEESEEHNALPSEAPVVARAPRDRHVQHGEQPSADMAHEPGDVRRRRRRRRRRRGRGDEPIGQPGAPGAPTAETGRDRPSHDQPRFQPHASHEQPPPMPAGEPHGEAGGAPHQADQHREHGEGAYPDGEGGRRRRRRGRRGGRRRGGHAVEGAPMGPMEPMEPMEPRAPIEIQGGRPLRGPGHEPGGPAEIETPIESAEDNGQPRAPAADAHDWPWNRRDEPPREEPPSRQTASKPARDEQSIAPRREPPRSSQQIAELGLPTADATSVPAAAEREPPSNSPQTDRTAPKGPPRRGWWRRLTE